jgi:hypothetical protein
MVTNMGRPLLDSAFIAAFQPCAHPLTARAANRRFGLLRALRTHTKAPYKPDLLWETLRALNSPAKARTISIRNGVRKSLHFLERGVLTRFSAPVYACTRARWFSLCYAISRYAADEVQTAFCPPQKKKLHPQQLARQNLSILPL